MKQAIFAATVIFSLFTAPAVMAEMVNINKADAATLDTLDGIGEKKAEAIVAYRSEHGEFKTLEDLMEVPGIGEGIYKKIEQGISLTDSATSVSEAPAKEQSAKAEPKADDTAKGAAGETGGQGKEAGATPKTEKADGKQATKADKS
ncbi:MAG: helix-hairpin-helix domain-containing protein [Thiothrix sp.]